MWHQYVCDACAHEQGLFIVPYYHPLLKGTIFGAPYSAYAIPVSPDAKLVDDGIEVLIEVRMPLQ